MRGNVVPDEQDFKPKDETVDTEAVTVDKEPSTVADGPERIDPSDSTSGTNGDAPAFKEQSHTKRTIVIAVVALLLIAVGALGVYFAMNQPKQETKETVATNEEPVKVEEDTTVSEALVGEISTELGTKFVNEGSRAPVYKPDGYDYHVRSSVEYQTQMTGIEDKAKNTLELIRETLKKRGYTETVTQDLEDGAMFEANFTGKHALCYVYMIAGISDIDSDGSSAGIACSDIETYAPEAEKMKPFVEAYMQSDQYETGGNMLYSGLTIKESSVAGYSNAELGVGTVDGVGGFAALFYRTSENAEWKFFIGTQNNLACTQYDTLELKKAYVGTECFDAKDTLTTVKL